MTAPTEQELRAQLDDRATFPLGGTTGGGLVEELRHLIRDWADPLTDPAFIVLDVNTEEWGRLDDPDRDDVLWRDLRPSEAIRLRTHRRCRHGRGRGVSRRHLPPPHRGRHPVRRGVPGRAA